MVNTELFEGQRESHKLWKKAPGTLAVATVLEAQQSLLTRQGFQPDVIDPFFSTVNSQAVGSVPPFLGSSLGLGARCDGLGALPLPLEPWW